MPEYTEKPPAYDETTLSLLEKQRSSTASKTSSPSQPAQHDVFIQLTLMLPPSMWSSTTTKSTTCRIHKCFDSGIYFVYENHIPEVPCTDIFLLPITFSSTTTTAGLSEQILPEMVVGQSHLAMPQRWKPMPVGVSCIDVIWNGVDNLHASGGTVVANHRTRVRADQDELLRRVLRKMEGRGWRDLLVFKLAFEGNNVEQLVAWTKLNPGVAESESENWGKLD